MLEALEKRDMVVIHANNEIGEYVLTNFLIENDSIKGTIIAAPEGKKHLHHENEFLAKEVDAYKPHKTMHIYSNINIIRKGDFTMSLEDIKVVEVHKDRAGKTFGIAFGSFIGGLGVVLAIVCTCPEVSAIDGNGTTQYHGSLFPGALLKSHQRGDYLLLENPQIDESGNLNLRVSNVLPETQYIDQLEVLDVRHPDYEQLGIDQNGALVAFNSEATAEIVNNQSDQDLTHVFSEVDEQSYDFRDLNELEELNAVTLRFDRATLSNHPALIIRAKQTQWLDTVANFIYYKGGKAHDKWVKRKDDSSVDKWKEDSQRRGLSLNVYLKENKKWKYVGSHHNVGTRAMRDLLMELDLTEINTPFIEIKLESAFRIWDVDYASLTDHWTADLEMTTLPVTKLINQSGQDVTEQLRKTDGNYHVQNEEGMYTALQVKVPVISSVSSLVLYGSGYYHQQMELDHSTDPLFFIRLRKNLGIQDVSRALYEYKTLQ